MKLSRKVSITRYNTVLNKYNQVPKNLFTFHEINVANNELIGALLGHIPYLHLDACYQIRKKWYKFQFCYSFGKVMRFAQLDMTSPFDGEPQVKKIRYIDIETV